MKKQNIQKLCHFMMALITLLGWNKQILTMKEQEETVKNNDLFQTTPKDDKPMSAELKDLKKSFEQQYEVNKEFTQEVKSYVEVNKKFTQELKSYVEVNKKLLQELKSYVEVLKNQYPDN